MAQRTPPSVESLTRTLRSNASGVGVAIRAARGRVLRAARTARGKKLHFNHDKVRALLTHIQNTQEEVEAEVGEFIQSPHLLFQPLSMSLVLALPMLVPLYFMPARLLLFYLGFVCSWYLMCTLYFATEVAMRPPWYKQGLPLKEQPYYWSHFIHNPKIDLAREYHDVSFKSSSGSTLTGWFIPGDKVADGNDTDVEDDASSSAEADDDNVDEPKPARARSSDKSNNSTNNTNNNMVVFVHGVGRDRRAFLRHAEQFLVRGYSCLLFDFSEHGNSGNLIPGRPRGSLFGAREMHDVMAAVDYLKREHGAGDVALVGTSCGAASAILAAASRPHMAACVVAENPYTRADDLLRHHLQTLSSNYLSQNSHQTVRRLVFWLAGKLLMLRMGHYMNSHGPVDVVGSLACPLLVAHSTEDNIVPYAHGRTIYELAAAAKEDAPDMVEFCAFSDAAHCALFDKDPEKWSNTVLAFVDKAFATCAARRQE